MIAFRVCIFFEILATIDDALRFPPGELWRHRFARDGMRFSIYR